MIKFSLFVIFLRTMCKLETESRSDKVICRNPAGEVVPDGEGPSGFAWALEIETLSVLGTAASGVHVDVRNGGLCVTAHRA